MKRLLLVAVATPLAWALPRFFAPRVSLAQGTNGNLLVPPRPPLDPEFERRSQAFWKSDFPTWQESARAGRELSTVAPLAPGSTLPFRVFVLPQAPFPNSGNGLFIGDEPADPPPLKPFVPDTTIWLRLDGVQPLSDAAFPSGNRSAAISQGNVQDEVRAFGYLHYGPFINRAWVRRTANEAWQQYGSWHLPAKLGYTLTRPELFLHQGQVFVRLSIRSYGGGQWRYDMAHMIYDARTGKDVGVFFRVETKAPIYGKAKGTAPWPRTRFDVFPPSTPLLKAIEYFDPLTKTWHKVPERGERGFPLAVDQKRDMVLRAMPLNPKRPWPTSPFVFPIWRTLRDGAVLGESRGPQSRILGSVHFPEPNSKQLVVPGFVPYPNPSSYSPWQIRPSRDNSDLATISASAGNTLQTQVRVLPQPTPTVAPTPIQIPGQIIPESSVGGSWGTVESVTALHGDSPFGDSTLWAVNKTSVAMAPQKFRAGVWFNDPIHPGDVKVVFHSRFTDGSPCGIWDVADLKVRAERGATEAIASFHPPDRVGLGFLWVDVYNRRNERIGGSKKQPFAVLPLALSCSTTEWRPTGQNNEWSREIHVFAKAQVPDAWQTPSRKSRGRTNSPFASLLSFLSSGIEPLSGIPIRLSLAPPPITHAEAMPTSILSATKGVTGPVPASGSTAVSTFGSTYSSTAPRVVTTQTVRWKLGDSNQLDYAQVVAQLDLPPTHPALPKGNTR